MPTIADIRQQYPQYKDLSDQQLAEGLHKKFYSDLPFNDFASKIGYKPQRFGTGKSLDVLADGTTVPTESIHYTGSGVVPASSGIAERQKKYGTTAGFDFSIKPENVRDLKSGVAPVVRGGWDAVSAVPSMAADLGVATRNLLTGSNYQLPSQGSEQALDSVLPVPNTLEAKTLRFGTGLLGGAKMPLPQISNPAPAGFVKPAEDLVRQQTLQAGQDAGFVVPPSTTNQTALNKLLESLGGKTGTAQEAAARNQDVFNKAAKKSLGLSEDAALTAEHLSALRAQAGNAYKNLKGVGDVVADSQYIDDLAKVTQRFSGAAKDFPELAKNEVGDLVDGALKDKFSSDSAVDLLSILRDKADKAFSTGDKALGKAYKDVSGAIEDLIQRNLTAAGKTDLVQKFKDARQLIAKTYSVEKAFNASTGNVVGTKLGAQLAKGKPLSGELKTAARFAQAFPKASSAVDHSGAVRNTDVILGAGATGVSQQPGWLLYPFARQAARNFLLSKAGQKLAVKGGGPQLPPEIAKMLLYGTSQGEQSQQP